MILNAAMTAQMMMMMMVSVPSEISPFAPLACVEPAKSLARENVGKSLPVVYIRADGSVSRFRQYVHASMTLREREAYVHSR